MIDWEAFVIVVVVALIAASVLVTLFSLALRFNEAGATQSRPIAVTFFVLCGVLVAFGIYLIVPSLHAFG